MVTFFILLLDIGGDTRFGLGLRVTVTLFARVTFGVTFGVTIGLR